MNPIPDHIQYLIQRLFDGSITSGEKAVLDDWYRSFASPETDALVGKTDEQIRARVKKRLDEFTGSANTFSQRRRKIIFSVAASFLLIVLTAGSYYYFMYHPQVNHKTAGNTPASVVVQDVLPGSDKAILTLGNGKVISLDSNSTGVLVQQDNMQVIKDGDGLLQYQKENAIPGGPKETVYNTIATPRGGQYRVKLADGTIVWLNSSSSIHFPVEFTDSIRRVEITGEAYFEVAHNIAKPFRVKVKDTYINVLGTHFDVMAYDNEESINTTLLEGSLTVTNNASSALVKPGQMAVSHASGKIKIIKEADMEEAIAWINGQFVFNSAGIHAIMRQVERWYDVDAVFENQSDLHFTGKVSRAANASELLRKLELTNVVHFRIEKNKITVLS